MGLEPSPHGVTACWERQTSKQISVTERRAPGWAWVPRAQGQGSLASPGALLLCLRVQTKLGDSESQSIGGGVLLEPQSNEPLKHRSICCGSSKCLLNEWLIE